MEENKIYLKGYKEGFYAALKMAWALAEDLYIAVGNSSKGAKAEVQEYIKKLNK